jgi:serine/threonine protein phosphatase PrpC
LTTANLGDSRAVLCREGGLAEDLSTDHKPDRSDEKARVEAAGGLVSDGSFFDCARVWAPSRKFGLAMSRAFGDFSLKPNGEARAKILIPDPDVTHVALESGDEFCLIATDGLWDVFTSAEACKLARGMIQKEEPIEIARVLAVSAYQRGSGDNVTVLVVKLGKDNDPQPLSRL